METLAGIFSLLDADSVLEVFMFFIKYGFIFGFMINTILDFLAYGIFKALSLVNIISR